VTWKQRVTDILINICFAAITPLSLFLTNYSTETIVLSGITAFTFVFAMYPIE